MNFYFVLATSDKFRFSLKKIFSILVSFLPDRGRSIFAKFKRIRGITAHLSRFRTQPTSRTFLYFRMFAQKYFAIAS